jgi:hypothetical protein
MDPLRCGEGISMERVITYAKGHLLQSNIHRVAPGGSSFGLISQAYQLSTGDTFCFRSKVAHGYRNRGRSEARIFFRQYPADVLSPFLVDQVT